MFDLKEALISINGRQLTVTELQQVFEKIRHEYASELPPEFGMRELFALAQDLDLLEEEADGNLKIKVA